MPLFEVAILEKPTPKEKDEGKLEKLIFGPTPVVAADPQSAAVSVALKKAGEIEVNLDRMQVLIRPFG